APLLWFCTWRCWPTLFLGLALVIAPVTLRNRLLGGEWVLVTHSGGINFYLGNGPGAEGTFRVPDFLPEAVNADAQFESFRTYAEKMTGRNLTTKEASDYWYDMTWAFIFANPMKWLKLLWTKFL